MLLAFAALAPCPVAAYAESTVHTINGKSFNLPTPSGFCIPDANNVNEGFFVKAVTTLMENAKTRVAKIAAECQEIKKRRADPRATVFDYVVYYYPASSESESIQVDAQTRRKALCDDLRRQGDSALGGVKDAVAKSAQEPKATIAMNSQKYLGVLAEDAHGCYVGVLSNVTTALGSFLLTANLMSTVIHGKTLFVGLYSQYKSPTASEKSLLLEQALAADLDSRNPD